jgi:hypothetical protein
MKKKIESILKSFASSLQPRGQEMPDTAGTHLSASIWCIWCPCIAIGPAMVWDGQDKPFLFDMRVTQFFQAAQPQADQQRLNHRSQLPCSGPVSAASQQAHMNRRLQAQCTN